ncbi:MAG: hypothetical protein AAFX01_03470 [Cyanobacteria bacterium J06638_28]
MSNPFPLAPRYRLDDEDTWLIGIDPIRRYWLAINGDETLQAVISGLDSEDFAAFREAVFSFREMHSGDSVQLPTRAGSPLIVKCVAKNCFLLEGEVNGYAACHLFDHESLESLLMTAHPDWVCAPQHKALGSKLLSLAWSQPTVSQVA